MHTYVGYALLATLAGALIPIMAGINGSLSQTIGSTYYAALVLLGVGFFAVLLVILFSSVPVPQQFEQSAPHQYIGGLIVAFYILSITFLVPRFGVGNSNFFVIVAQVISAAVIDHFGLLDAEIRLINLKRAIGITFLLAGIYIARK